MKKPWEVGTTIGELMAKEFAERLEYWGPVLTRSSLNMIYAKRGIGKTMFCMRLAYAMATGTKYLKWGTYQPRKVLYFECEMGGDLTQKRFMAFEKELDLGVHGSQIKIISYADCGGTMWNLADPKFQLYYTEASKPYEVIIIDNLNTATAPLSKWDDDVAQWLRIQPWLIKQRDAGKCIVIVHHANKAGDQNGTRLRENIMDTIIALRERVDTSEALSFELVFEKNRSFHGSDTEPLLIDMTTDASGRASWMWTSAREDRRRSVQRLKAQGKKRRQIAEELGLDLFTVGKLWSEDYEDPQEVKPREESNDDQTPLF